MGRPTGGWDFFSSLLGHKREKTRRGEGAGRAERHGGRGLASCQRGFGDRRRALSGRAQRWNPRSSPQSWHLQMIGLSTKKPAAADRAG